MSGLITALLVAHRQGDVHAFDQLFPLVYEDLSVWRGVSGAAAVVWKR